MSKIKIHSAEGIAATRVWLDDQEVRELTDVQVSCPLDDVVRVRLAMMASESFDLVADEAKVFVQVKALPGMSITATPQPDGRVIYRATFDKPAVVRGDADPKESRA